MQAIDRAQRHHERGGAHKVAGRLKAAEQEFRAALALDPTRAASRYALGITLLGQGRYPEGFPFFESRHQVPEFRNHKPDLPFPEWRGESVAGRRIVIWPEQGLGDQIQFARFGPILKAMGADVTLLCAPALARLFQRLGIRVVAASGAVEFPDPDAWVMCGSIAGRLGLTVAGLPAGPYLSAGSVAPAPRRARLLRVGVATRGNPNHANDQHRSLGKAEVDRLLALPVEFVSLHPEDTGAKDFQDTADLIAGLDLVISVDTSVAHLAGAMGQEVWTLIPAFNTDWRWMQGRSDSPWYPSMRLFRQAAPSGWTEVIDAIAAALSERSRTIAPPG
jgi:hypothetical protein